ncbi:hypothetical protein VPH35_006664 [Triticum aestivum]
MARGDHQNDDDDFMDPPQRNRATGRRKEGDEKKKRIRNRASQERLTALTDKFIDDQKGAAAEMGIQALMDVRCTNLVNPVCDWLGEIYDPASREFVIPGHGRLPLNEESVFYTLGVPRGHIKVPYELMYVDCLDLSTVDFTGTGGTPPTHEFAVSAWTINAVKVVLTADRVTDTKYGKLQLMAKHAIDYSMFGGPQNFGKWMDVHSAPSCLTEARAPVEHLIGQFASGMTGLLGKLVEGWTSLSGSDSDAVARQFTSFVPKRTHWPTGCRGRYDYNSSQEPSDTQDELDGDAGLSNDDDDDMENVQQDTDDDEHAEVRVGGNKGKDATDAPPPEKVKEHTTARGEGVLPSRRGRAPEDVGQGSPGKRVKKTTTRGAKHIIKDPLERLHSKLSTGGNSDVHEAPGDNTAAAPSTAPTNSDASGRPSPPAADVQARITGIRTSGSDESVSARTAEILPTLLAMKDAAVSHATPSASVEVDAPETNLSKEYSRSSDTDSKCVRGGTPVSTTEAAEAAVHNDMPSTATPKEISPSLDEAYHRIEEAALQRRSSRGQGQSSTNVPADTVSEDTIRSATPSSVRQQRVVHPPPAEDYEPEFRATKEQTQLYDIVKRFGNARSSSKHMKELKA